MTLQKLASEIAKREGKKSQARIGDVREILGILADIWHEGDNGFVVDFLDALTVAGQKRARKVKKK
jgi:hypothetical protein